MQNEQLTPKQIRKNAKAIWRKAMKAENPNFTKRSYKETSKVVLTF